MPQQPEDFDGSYEDMFKRAMNLDIASEDATRAFRNLAELSKLRPTEPTPEPDPILVAEPTRWQKARAAAAAVLDNETTRTLIKAGGAFAGVAFVAATTIKRDHVIERQALQQANQRPS